MEMYFVTSSYQFENIMRYIYVTCKQYGMTTKRALCLQRAHVEHVLHA